MADSVFVRGLEFEGNHGYTAAERRGTRRFRVNLSLEFSLAAASLSDKLVDTVDYWKVSEIVVSIGTKSTFKLIEALAGSMARKIQELYPSASVMIELEKLAPPCPGVPAACGVRLVLPALPADALRPESVPPAAGARTDALRPESVPPAAGARTDGLRPESVPPAAGARKDGLRPESVPPAAGARKDGK